MNGFLSFAQLGYAAALVATSMFGALFATVSAPDAPVALAEQAAPLALVEGGKL